MKVGTGGNLDLSREYHKKLFWPLFYLWWNCPLRIRWFQNICFHKMPGLVHLFSSLPYTLLAWSRDVINSRQIYKSTFSFCHLN